MIGNRPGYFGGKARPPARYNPVVPKKAAPKKAAPKNTAPKGMPSTAGLTPQQWVAQALRAEMAPLDYTEAARAKRAAEQQTQTQYATQAIIKELGAQQAPLAGMFDNAVAQQKGYATDYANMLRNANPNAQNQADLQAIGAPAAQQQQIAASNQANFGGQGANLFYSQGVIPGNTLLANRNAELGYLGTLPTVMGLSGQQALGAQARANLAAHQDYVANRMKIAGQGPGLLMQVQQQRLAQHNALVSQYQRDTQLAQNARALGDREGYQQAQINLAQDRNALANSRYQTGIDQFNVTAGQRNTALDIQQQNANTAKARAAAAAQAKIDTATAKTLKTAKQRQMFWYSQRAKAFAAAKSMFGTPTAPGNSGVIQWKSATSGPTIKRQAAFTKLWVQYWPVFRAAGFKRDTVRQMVINALNTAAKGTTYWAQPPPPAPKRPPRG